MRKHLRLALQLGISLLLLVAAGIVATVQPVDLTPYLRAPYTVRTRERLASQPPPVWAEGRLEIGFGRASLTPGITGVAAEPATGRFPGIALAGYGGREGRPAIGVHDELWARAVALRVGHRRVVFVAAEALIVPREVADATARLLKATQDLDRADLYLGATHTHASFGGWGEGPVARQFAGPHQDGVRDWFARQLAEGAARALADLTPGAFGHGRLDIPEFVRNRLVGDLGRVDPDFNFLLFRQEDGDRAVIGAYAAHATVLPDEVMQFSGDWPAAWSHALESTGISTVLFLAGAMGSHSPVPGARGFEGTKRMGHALAERLAVRLPDVSFATNVVLATLGLEVDLPDLQCRLSDTVRLRPWVARRLLPPHPANTWLQALRLSDALWIATPCDFSGELARPIKAHLRQSGLDPAITSFNGDYIGYVIPGRYYHLAGYEPRVMSFYGPGIPDYLEELILRMADRLWARAP